MTTTLEKIWRYVWLIEKMCRAFTRVRGRIQRVLDNAVERRAQELAAKQMPQVFWIGFGVALFFGLSLVAAASTSRR